MRCLSFFILGSLYAAPALSYVGPGAGLSAVGAFLALLLAVLAAVLGFFWYPIKRMITGSGEPGDEPVDVQQAQGESSAEDSSQP